QPRLCTIPFNSMDNIVCGMYAQKCKGMCIFKGNLIHECGCVIIKKTIQQNLSTTFFSGLSAPLMFSFGSVHQAADQPCFTHCYPGSARQVGLGKEQFQLGNFVYLRRYRWTRSMLIPIGAENNPVALIPYKCRRA